LLTYEKGKWIKAYAVLVCIAALILALTTVSRGALLTCSGMLCMWAFFARRLLATVGVAVFAVGCYFAFLVDSGTVANELMTSTVTRAARASDSVIVRMGHVFTDAWSIGREYPLGVGLGVGQTATRQFRNSAVVETELARVIYEIGLIGAVGYLLVYGGAAYFLWRQASTIAGMHQRVGVMFCAVACGLLMFSGVAFNHVTSLAFWGVFSGGVYINQLAWSLQRNRLAMAPAKARGFIKGMSAPPAP
ncbi:MAG: O-antigen ligase family protein, partial [Pirellulaceae bacterium]